MRTHGKTYPSWYKESDMNLVQRTRFCFAAIDKPLNCWFKSINGGVPSPFFPLLLLNKSSSALEKTFGLQRARTRCLLWSPLVEQKLQFEPHLCRPCCCYSYSASILLRQSVDNVEIPVPLRISHFHSPSHCCMRCFLNPLPLLSVLVPLHTPEVSS